MSQNERVGFTGWVDDKFKVFYEGSFYFVQVDGRALVIDWDKIESSRKRLI